MNKCIIVYIHCYVLLLWQIRSSILTVDVGTLFGNQEIIQ